MPRNEDRGSISCPACGHRMAPKKIHEHTSECEGWKEQFGDPLPYFKWDKYSKKHLFGERLVEGQDYVQCKVCLQYGWDFRFTRMMDHLKKVHGLTEGEYKMKFPGAPVRLSTTLEKRKKTVKKRYGVDNVFQDEGVKEKSRETAKEKYGVNHAAIAPEVQRKRAATNLVKYGHENPLGGQEGTKRAQEGMESKYGETCPQRVPEIQEKTRETNRERYGSEHYFETDEFKEKFKAVCLEKWGVVHPMKSEEVRERLAAVFMEKYGVENPLLDPTIQQQAYETNLANHGGRHSQQCPEVRAKAQKTWLEKYGVDNPSKSEEIKRKIKKVWTQKYGVPFPPQSMWSNQTHTSPNKLEQQVNGLSTEFVVYAGDGSYWVGSEETSQNRNPDFIILTRAQLAAYRDGTKLNDLRTSALIENFGDYWHGPQKTGKDRFTHRREVEMFYEDQGISCLVLWESEIKHDPKRVAERIKKYVAKWRRGGYRKMVKGPNVIDMLLEE